MKSKVYFTKSLTALDVVRLYDTLGFDLKGKVAVNCTPASRETKTLYKPTFGNP